MNLSICCTRLADRIAHFLPNWEVLTKDQWALQTVGDYQLDLVRSPYQPQIPNQIKTTQENSTLVTLEVMEMLSKGAIVETQLTQDSFVSQIFLVEKKDGGQRPVINLKTLLLPFQWEEKYYMFTFLLFGLSAAPRIFTKLLKPVVGIRWDVV